MHCYEKVYIYTIYTVYCITIDGMTLPWKSLEIDDNGAVQ